MLQLKNIETENKENRPSIIQEQECHLTDHLLHWLVAVVAAP